MKTSMKSTAKVQKLSDLAKKIDRQLMDLLVKELENFRSNSGSGSANVRIA
ncbi:MULTISPECIES: hypothetical protein [Olivibacter]|uniref:Uncharacterized protein n=2 Tax=Sphingobacteriaceae TaxID=84566 RepID=F4C856_SPHS2|nr:hypothetical protein [Olivibacter sp. UJ_SKK_5.1]MDX3912618.1 hypothetical protein [Pseudosphingobacterium sp.]